MNSFELKGHHMIKTRILLAGIVLLVLAGTASAQGVDAFVGYSFLNGNRGVSGRETDQGWMANVSGNVNDLVGIVGDVGAHYQDGIDVRQYMGGIRLTNRENRVAPFFQGLIGGVRVDGSGPAETYFALGLGGGVDYRVHDHVAMRVVQVDWLPFEVGDDWETSFVRFGFGVTFVWD